MAHFCAGGKPPPPRPRSFDCVISSITHSRIALLQHLGQGLEAAVVEVLLDALGIDHAVVPQGDAALAVEERHVAVELEELPADGLAGHLQPLDHLAAQDVLADDLVADRPPCRRGRAPCRAGPAGGNRSSRSSALQAPKQLARATRDLLRSIPACRSSPGSDDSRLPPSRQPQRSLPQIRIS